VDNRSEFGDDLGASPMELVLMEWRMRYRYDFNSKEAATRD
jgi:hypothetical protein